MHGYVFASLLLIWGVWMLPFLLGRLRQRDRQPAVIVKSARWGIVLQGIAFGIAWGFRKYFWTHPLVGWRIALSLGLGILSVICAWSSVSHLGRQWRIDAGLNADHELVQSGAYRFVRHPIYASMLGLYLMWGLLLPPWPVFLIGLALCIAGLEIRVRIEDDLLAKRFGSAFTAWKSKLPAYLPLIR